METQQLEIISIDDHPVHGTFEVEVPQEYNDDQVRSYVGGLDLDLLLGVNDKESLGETNVEKIKEWENSTGAGKRDDKWFPHASLEGGTDTVAYGHKLTQEEADTGIIKVGDKEYNWREGLSDDAALAILDKDAGSAKNVALASLTKANMADDENKVQALTSLIYNVGSGAWGKSKAKKYLEAGNVEDFMHEAFSSEVGFVKINGDQSRGLVRRRAAEAQLFAQGNIDKGDSIMSQILDAINPISSAQAATMADVIPQSQPTGQLGGVTVSEGKPEAPAVEDMGRESGQTSLAEVSVPRKVKGGEATEEPSGGFSFSLFSEAQASEIQPLQQNEVPTPQDIISTAKSKNFVRAAWKTVGIHEDNVEDQKAVKGFIDNAIGKTDALGSDPAEVATKQAWCSAWLYHVLTSAGVDRTKLANQMNSDDPYDFVRARTYKKVGEPVWKKGEDNISAIKTGDVMVKMHTQAEIDDPSNGLKGRRVGYAGHVGIVTKVKGDEVYYLSGNSGGKQVRESSYNLKEKDITIRRPTGVENVPKEIVDEVVAEEEWGSMVGLFTRLFSAKDFIKEAVQIFKETGTSQEKPRVTLR